MHVNVPTASRMNSNNAHSLQGSCECSSWCSHFSCRGSSWKSSWCSKRSRWSCSWCSFGGLFSCWRSCYSSFICQGAEIVMIESASPPPTNDHQRTQQAACPVRSVLRRPLHVMSPSSTSRLDGEMATIGPPSHACHVAGSACPVRCSWFGVGSWACSRSRCVRTVTADQTRENSLRSMSVIIMHGVQPNCRNKISPRSSFGGT